MEQKETTTPAPEINNECLLISVRGEKRLDKASIAKQI